MEDFKWFIGVLVILGVVWFFNGGPERASSRDPFIHQPSPIGEGTTYTTKKSFWDFLRFPFSNNMVPTSSSSTSTNSQNETSSDKPNAQETTTDNTKDDEVLVYKEFVQLVKSSAGSTNPPYEYVTIKVSSKSPEPIIFDNWMLQSTVTGNKVSIAKATYLPRLGSVNTDYAVKAQPGDTITITTGRSPIGSSFRTNKCIGYLEQFQDFSPSLPSECPRPMAEIPAEYEYGSNPNAFNDACVDFIAKIGTCRINTKDIPYNMQPQCQEFIAQKLNYNACISAHSNEPDFYGKQWRVYLGRDSELWKSKREIIELVDPNGNVIDVVSY